MKYLLIVPLFLAPLVASADTLSCPAGQMVASVEVTPATDAVPAVTHTVHHDAVTHTETVIDTPAWDETVTDTAAYDSFTYVGNGHGDYDQHNTYASGRIYYAGKWYSYEGHNHGAYDIVHHAAVTHTVHHDAVTHEVTVTDAEAYDEEVVDSPAVPGTDAVYEDQCVTDPDYVAPSEPTPTPAAPSKHHGGQSLTGCYFLYSLTGSCNQDEASKFTTDKNYHDSLILKWRFKIFGY